MKLFDTHCHLDDEVYDIDIEAVIKRAHMAGIETMMIAGINQDSSGKAVSMAESRSGIYASVGIHPHDARDCCGKVLEFLRVLAGSPKVRAWGEIGLDFNRMHSSREDQERCLMSQLEIASELKLPVIFHERDSNGRFLEILHGSWGKGRSGVVHCFSGTEKELEQYLSMGLFIGITGIITIEGRGARLRELVRLIPVERIVVETDAPYLTPAPERNRTKRNEPAFVKSVFFKLAAVRQEDPEILADVVWENSCRLFGPDLETRAEG
jgi:TatD DNase family protein